MARLRRLPLLLAVTGALLVATPDATANVEPVPSATPSDGVPAPEQIEPVAVTWLNDRLAELTFENTRLNPPLAHGSHHARTGSRGVR